MHLFSNFTFKVPLGASCSRIPNPESRIPNPESRIPNPESRIPNPESRIPNPVSRSVASPFVAVFLTT
ncbi:hypothetical protein C1N51_04450 [Vibrio campbellii]|nr:hypothetical protein C1N51_04450 [Vibrio campbellii]